MTVFFCDMYVYWTFWQYVARLFVFARICFLCD